MWTRQTLLEALDQAKISYEVTDHPPIFQMADNEGLDLPYPGQQAKNLFLHNRKKSHYYLLCLKSDQTLDLKLMAHQLNESRLSLAKEEELQSMLGLSRGSVTPFGLLNDEGAGISLIVDDSFFGDSLPMGVHPIDNRATLWLSAEDLITFLGQRGYQIQLLNVQTLGAQDD